MLGFPPLEQNEAEVDIYLNLNCLQTLLYDEMLALQVHCLTHLSLPSKESGHLSLHRLCRQVNCLISHGLQVCCDCDLLWLACKLSMQHPYDSLCNQLRRCWK